MSVGGAGSLSGTCAVSLYVSTCRLAMLAAAVADDGSDDHMRGSPTGRISARNNNNNNISENNGERCTNPSVHWTELYRVLPILRQALTCGHCSRIVVDPVIVGNASTSNCRSCATRHDPTLAMSSQTDVQMKIVVQCYQKLCQFLESFTGFYRKLGGISTNGNTRVLADFIAEGAALGSRGVDLEVSRPPLVGRVADSHFLLARLLAAPPMSNEQLSLPVTCNGLQTSTAAVSADASSSAQADPQSYSVSMDVDRSTRITIKRKHKSSSSSSSSCTSSSSSSSMSSSSSSNDSLPLAAYVASARSSAYYKQLRIATGSSHRGSHQHQQQQSTTTNKQPTISETKSSTKACRCGNATLHPGKLTCCGQRCPCYVDKLACEHCKCRGCKNPRNSNTAHDASDGGRSDVKASPSQSPSSVSSLSSSSSTSSSSTSSNHTAQSADRCQRSKVSRISAGRSCTKGTSSSKSRRSIKP